MTIDSLNLGSLTPEQQRFVAGLIAALTKDMTAPKQYHDPIDNIPFWVASLRSEGRSPGTIALYGADAKRYLGQDHRPTRLTIERYMARRLDQGISASRVSSEQKSLKSLFRYLHQEGLWPEDPCARMRLAKGPQKEVQCPSDETIAELIGTRLYRRKDEAKFKMMLLLLLDTGMRLGEACLVERGNINLRSQEIRILGKGNKERLVPISKPVAELLQQFMERTAGDSPYLFPGNTRTGSWTLTSFERMLKRACQRRSIEPPVHPHQLRHYFATKRLQMGASLKAVSEMLGHTSIAITGDIYQHINLAELHKQHEKFNPLTALLGGELCDRGGSHLGESEENL